MSKLAQVGDFCPNTTCADYGKRQGQRQASIVKFGKTKAGRQLSFSVGSDAYGLGPDAPITRMHGRPLARPGKAMHPAPSARVIGASAGLCEGAF